MEDVLYKLRKIKFRRTIFQIKEDIYRYMSINSDKIPLDEYLSEKYPEMGIEMNKTFDEKTSIWNFNITIQKPVEIIENVFTITPNGIKYNN
jgi:hypothetical protein